MLRYVNKNAKIASLKKHSPLAICAKLTSTPQMLPIINTILLFYFSIFNKKRKGNQKKRSATICANKGSVADVSFANFKGARKNSVATKLRNFLWARSAKVGFKKNHP